MLKPRENSSARDRELSRDINGELTQLVLRFEGCFDSALECLEMIERQVRLRINLESQKGPKC